MHLDKYGLPVQADGDANDQLQRCGMIVTASSIINDDAELTPLEEACATALSTQLQPKPGIFIRCIGGETNNVSADQLISALAAFVMCGVTPQAWKMFVACIKRFGFAQNTRDGLDGSDRKKLPDFMLLRALPLFARAHPILYPGALLADFLLLALVLTAVGPVFRDEKLWPSRRSPDDVDHNNTILTLAVCSERMPTPLSWLARKIFGRFCPWNLGCADEIIYKNGTRVIFSHNAHPVYGSLRWYHRAEAGGNPEIAELWKPICKRLFE